MLQPFVIVVLLVIALLGMVLKAIDIHNNIVVLTATNLLLQDEIERLQQALETKIDELALATSTDAVQARDNMHEKLTLELNKQIFYEHNRNWRQTREVLLEELLQTISKTYWDVLGDADRFSKEKRGIK